jgi:hypothetical protein
VFAPASRLLNKRPLRSGPSEEIDMDRRAGFRWLVGLSVIALCALIGVYIYDLGVAHGLAEGARTAGLGGGDAPVLGWWRAQHLGFGFFPFFPFLFVLLWFVVLRGFLWRGPWYGRGWYGRGWSHGRGEVPRAFEEWHRRAHDQQERPSAETKG